MLPAIAYEPASPVILSLGARVTEEELIDFARNNPEYRFETTADGRLVVSPLTGTFASFGEGELFFQLELWNKSHKLGFVLPATGGITLANGAIKGPDAAFISHRRMATLSPNRKKRAFEEIAPDAVFELRSPSDDLPTLQAKCEEYIGTGSGVAVLLDPRDRSVSLYRKGCDTVIIRDAGAVAIGPEVPGFILDAPAVFEASNQTS